MTAGAYEETEKKYSEHYCNAVVKEIPSITRIVLVFIEKSLSLFLRE